MKKLVGRRLQTRHRLEGQEVVLIGTRFLGVFKRFMPKESRWQQRRGDSHYHNPIEVRNTNLVGCHDNVSIQFMKRRFGKLTIGVVEDGLSCTGTGSVWDCEERQLGLTLQSCSDPNGDQKLTVSLETGLYSYSNIFDYSRSCTNGSLRTFAYRCRMFMCESSEKGSTSFDGRVVRRSDRGSEVDTVSINAGWLTLFLQETLQYLLVFVLTTSLKKAAHIWLEGPFARVVVIHNHEGPRLVRRKILSIGMARNNRSSHIIRISDHLQLPTLSIAF
ncbi:unnamed protein product [Haemonchus placei]|uniref:ZP domain-containing protein n=1 Tax=Haemonchus placei TaxID=6290 RepID=A0A0N4WRD1_HAEPC|nr:unnamed protein product [Haemonchus placei]